jgi:hypothetical protein
MNNIVVRQSIDRFHEQAMAQTGLSDFGSKDYLEGMEVLMASYDDEANLNTGMCSFVSKLVSDALCARLITEEGFRQNPDCLNNPIERPIVIAGLPRIGSTALQRLLAADVSNQAPELWLAGHPMPRPPRDQWAEHPVFKANQDNFSALSEHSPELKGMHEMSPDLPDECVHIMSQDFAALTFSNLVTAPTYDRWLLEADLTYAYQRHRKVLCLIGANEPNKRWVLKDPAGLGYLKFLLRVYPDACIVFLHRDPVNAMASFISLMRTSVIATGTGYSPDHLMKRELEWNPAVLKRALCDRQDQHDNFLDVAFSDFIKDPIEFVANIYAHFDIAMSAESRAAMQQHAEQNKKGKHGGHRYSASDFGLTDDGIRKAFDFYYQQCGEYL